MLKNTSLLTNPIFINDSYKNSSKIGTGMVSFNVCKAELLALKFPVLWTFLGASNVVTGHREIRVSGLRCLSIKCKGNPSRYILHDSNVSIERKKHKSGWLFTLKIQEIFISNAFACESIWARSLVRWGISFSARAGRRYMRRRRNGILSIRWKAYQRHGTT